MNIFLIVLMAYFEIGIIACGIRIVYAVYRSTLWPVRGTATIAIKKADTQQTKIYRLPWFIILLGSFFKGVLAWPYFLFYKTKLEILMGGEVVQLDSESENAEQQILDVIENEGGHNNGQ